MNIIKQIISRAMRRQLSRFDELYQRHAGQECYIFGDGISLKWMDLRQFTNLPSILGGVSIFHKEADELNSLYCAFTEPLFFYPIVSHRCNGKLRFYRNYYCKEFLKSMVQNPDIVFFINISNYLTTRFLNTMFVSRWYNPPFENRNPFRARSDAHQGTFKFQIALAIYLGFKRAYLVGHDYTHSLSRSRHFYEKGEGVLNGNKDFNKDYINYAKQYIDLVTVTVEGGSETMSSVTYKDLTGKVPVFRENIELVDRVKLKSLARWHAYSIY